MRIVCSLALTALLSAVSVRAQTNSLGPTDTWAAAKLSAQEAQQIIAGAEQSAFDSLDSWQTELRVKRVDLGSSPGIIAQGTRRLCGGTGNCQIFAFRKAQDTWISLFEGDAPIGESFQLGPATTHGIKDLTVVANSGAATRERAVYKFDGRFYQKAAAPARAASRSRKPL